MVRMELRIHADQRSDRRVFSEADSRVQKTEENK